MIRFFTFFLSFYSSLLPALADGVCFAPHHHHHHNEHTHVHCEDEHGVVGGRALTREMIHTELSSVRAVHPEGAALNQHPYHPRRMEAHLEAGLAEGENMTSRTLPRINQKNVKLAGQRHPVTGIVFNERGMPVFDNVAVFDVMISREVAIIKIKGSHMKCATQSLNEAIRSGKLKKMTPVRDTKITERYRDNIVTQAEKQWGQTEPERVERIERLIKNMDADHVHELQLGGVDELSALSMLDKGINRSVGVQLMHQLKHLPEGTRITRIIEEKK